MRKYPYYKVVFGFLLCPVVAGIAFTLFAFGYDLTNKVILEVSMAYMGFAVIFVVSGLFFYGIPAVFLGVVYSFLRLHKGVKEYLFVFFMGGGVSYAWGPLINFLFPTDRVEPFPGLLWHSSVPFFLGAGSSFLISLWVLPKKD